MLYAAMPQLGHPMSDGQNQDWTFEGTLLKVEDPFKDDKTGRVIGTTVHVGVDHQTIKFFIPNGVAAQFPENGTQIIVVGGIKRGDGDRAKLRISQFVRAGSAAPSGKAAPAKAGG